MISCKEDKKDLYTTGNAKDTPISTNNPPLKNTPVISTIAVDVVKYEALFKVWENAKDTLLIVNYWATWCKPCVQELPHFFKIYSALKDTKKIKLILVSLDTRDNLHKEVIPFLQNNEYETNHYLLDDNGRMNEWIPKVSADWEGEIPATGFYKNGKQLEFVAGAMSEQELEKTIQKHL